MIHSPFTSGHITYLCNTCLVLMNRLTPELKYFGFSQLILGYKQTFCDMNG